MSDATAKGGFNGILLENKATMQSIEAYGKAKISGWPRFVLMGILALVCFGFIGMFATGIIAGIKAAIFTLIGGIIIALLIFGIRTFDPVIRQKARNAKMEMMVKEARKHAVAQLDNQVVLNTQRLDKSMQATNKMGGAVRNLEDKLGTMKKDSKFFAKMSTLYTTAQKTYEQCKVNYKVAKGKFAEFEEQVLEYKDMEKFAGMFKEAMGYAGDAAGAKIEEMLSLESFDAIATDFNAAVIMVENSSMEFAGDDNIEYEA